MEYRMRYRDRNGRIKNENAVFGSRDEAVETFLHKKGIILVSCRELKKSRRKSGDMLLEWTCEMEELMASGLTLEESLDLTSASERIGVMSSEIRSGIRNGKRLFEILGDGRWKIPSIYESMIKIGEEACSMERIFLRLKDYLEKKKRITEKIISSLLYPSIVLTLTAACLFLVVVLVLPRMREMFAGISPGTEDVFARTASGLHRKVMTAAAMCMTAMISFFLAKKSGSRKAAETADRLMLKIPFAGSIITEYETMILSFGMEILSDTGKPVRDALSECAPLIGNSAYRNAVLRAGELVGQGGNLSDAVSASGIIPSYVADWIRIGESTGSGSRVFSQIRHNYERIFEKRLERFTSIIEPAVIILTGMIFMGVIAEFMVPVFSIYGNL